MPMPKIELKNSDVSEESYSDALRVATWYNPKKNAATKGIRDLESKILNPGLIIIKTPIKPINIAIHVFTETYSFKNTDDIPTTITGVKEAILWASAKDKYRKARTKHDDSIIDKTDLKIWSLIFLDL